MKFIINLTQHKATQDQINAGVIDLPDRFKEKLVKNLNFEEIPSKEELEKRAMNVYDTVIEFLSSDSSPLSLKERVEIVDKAELDENGHIYFEDEAFIKDFNIGFMIGGAPFFIPYLIYELQYIGTPLFAFSKRVSVEVQNEDGSVEKKSVFKHEGFVEVCDVIC